MLGTGPEIAGGAGPLEDCNSLPSLPDLLDELNRDVDLGTLEQITQSLLEDIAADLEAAAEKANCQKPEGGGENFAGKVVGPSPENLEPGGSVGLSVQSETDVSEFLLLHHDYSKTTRPVKKRPAKKRPEERKFKQIKPKLEEIKPEIKIEPMDVSETVYGTYDEENNCITIYVDDDSVQVKEEVVDYSNVANDHSYLKVPESECSFRTSSPSDCGYESLGSPNSLSDVDLWDQSVSELFPSLM